VRALMPQAPEAKVRARAGAIGFPEAMADTPSGQLSGGEKSRLMLGLATLGGPHLVILDEPTNHLDIDSRAALIAAINDFPGAVILVSHDRYLIEACSERLWLVSSGGVAPFDGDLDDYRRFVLSDRGSDGKTSDARQKGRAPRGGRAEVRRAAAQMRIELAPLRRRIADAEAAVKRHTRKSRASTRRSPRLACSLAIRAKPPHSPSRAPTPRLRSPAPRMTGFRQVPITSREHLGPPAAWRGRRVALVPQARPDFLAGFCGLGACSGSGPRSIELSRPSTNR